MRSGNEWKMGENSRREKEGWQTDTKVRFAGGELSLNTNFHSMSVIHPVSFLSYFLKFVGFSLHSASYRNILNFYI